MGNYIIPLALHGIITALRLLCFKVAGAKRSFCELVAPRCEAGLPKGGVGIPAVPLTDRACKLGNAPLGGATKRAARPHLGEGLALRGLVFLIHCHVCINGKL